MLVSSEVISKGFRSVENSVDVLSMRQAMLAAC
jgi:hypothetical protein